jgi:thiol-disulfide isomerase/thioredoxin
VWCKRLAPIFEGVEKDYPDATFTRLNILASEENSALGEKYGIMGTPTTKIFCNGRPVGEIIGFKQNADFKTDLDRILQNSNNCLQNSTPK